MSSNKNLEEHSFTAFAIALRLSFIALLLIISFKIVMPFVMPIVWGIIISVGIYPVYAMLTKALKGKKGLASTIIVVIGISILVVPFSMLISSSADSIDMIVTQLTEGTFKIPEPPSKVAEWPLIGEKVYGLWQKSSSNLDVLVEKLSPYLTTVLPKIFSSAAGVVGTVFQFIFAMIIAGIFLVNADGARKTAVSVFKAIIGEDGEGFVEISQGTIKGVVQGILGTAVIQTVFIGLGFFVVGVPGAGIWTVLVLLLAIVQIPPTLITLPIVIYIFGVEGTTISVVFAIWALGWSASDNVIKPILMGRGVDIPMLVILLGSIGGMMAFGIIGLFIGAVVLAISYKVIIAMGEKIKTQELNSVE